MVLYHWRCKVPTGKDPWGILVWNFSLKLWQRFAANNPSFTSTHVFILGNSSLYFNKLSMATMVGSFLEARGGFWSSFIGWSFLLKASSLGLLWWIIEYGVLCLSRYIWILRSRQRKCLVAGLVFFFFQFGWREIAKFSYGLRGPVRSFGRQFVLITLFWCLLMWFL